MFLSIHRCLLRNTHIHVSLSLTLLLYTSFFFHVFHFRRRPFEDILVPRETLTNEHARDLCRDPESVSESRAFAILAEIFPLYLPFLMYMFYYYVRVYSIFSTIVLGGVVVAQCVTEMFVQARTNIFSDYLQAFSKWSPASVGVRRLFQKTLSTFIHIFEFEWSQRFHSTMKHSDKERPKI